MIKEILTKYKIELLCILAGFVLGLYSISWSGWYFILDFFLLSSFLVSGYVIYKKDWKLLKLLLKINIIIVLSTIIFVILFSGTGMLKSIIIGPLQFLILKDTGKNNLWPIIEVTIAELSVPSQAIVMNYVGGVFLVISSIIGALIAIFWKKYRNLIISVMVLLLIIMGWYSTKTGIRFILFLAPAIALGFALLIGILWQEVKDKKDQVIKYLTLIIILSLTLFLAYDSFKQSNDIAKNSVPMMNDMWYDTLTNIDKNSDGAVIVSWWDYGHYFASVGNSNTIFDGGAQTGYDAYWIGKTFSTTDPDMSIGIIRMLNCGQNTAFEKLNNKINDTIKSVDMLNQILSLKNKNALNKLCELTLIGDEPISTNNPKYRYLCEEIVNEYTHCFNQPTNYIIVSGDMVGKSGVWSHYGSWDFNKASIYQDIQDGIDIKLKYNLTIEENIAYQQKASQSTMDTFSSQYIGYSQEGNPYGYVKCIPQSYNTICKNSFTYEYNTHEIKIWQGNEINYTHPYSVVYIDNGTIQERKFDDYTVEVSIIIVNNETAVIAHKDITNSMFTKLYYLNGVGLEKFKKFSDMTWINGDRVIVYEIDFK